MFNTPPSQLSAFEIRFHYSHDDPTDWSTRDFVSMLAETAAEAAAFTKVVFQSDPKIKTIRWNWIGSSQGHYFSR